MDLTGGHQGVMLVFSMLMLVFGMLMLVFSILMLVFTTLQEDKKKNESY